MEYPIYQNYLPIGTFNSPYYNYQDLNSPPPGHGSSDSSMDTSIREPLKLKEVQDELFSWAGDMRSSLDEDRSPYSVTQDQMCSNERNNSRPVKQEPCKSLTRIENYQSQTELSKSDRGKEKEQFVSKETKTGEAAVRVEMDMYLEKPQMAIVGNQMSCEIGPHDVGTVLPRKRKMEGVWQSGKARQIVQQREIINSGRITSGWHMDDLEIDLSGELSNASYNMNDALLSLPVFKQEIPSPTNVSREQPSPPRTAPWLARQQMMINGGMGINSTNPNCNSDQAPAANQTNGSDGGINQQQGIVNNSHQQNNQIASMTTSPINNDQNVMEVASGLISSTTNTPLDMYGSPSNKSTPQPSTSPSSEGKLSDNRFQYILAAATSIATKCNEDTLTYLNQCQSYEIKFKKLGDLSHFKGKLFKSVIRICFHERRLQFAEREQMSLWQSERPGERIVEVDLPLSYGLIHVNQPNVQSMLNCVEIYWEPVKEVGAYIKINCISTEFTAKKHGGEKGVPFRIQIETFIPGTVPPELGIVSMPNTPDKRLHAAACQVKVFKLKGADRKHKQDREKVFRRPPSEREKYQPSYDCTIFTELTYDALFIPMLSTSQYSPEQSGSSVAHRPAMSSPNSPLNADPANHQLALHTQLGEVKLHDLSRTNSHGSSLDCEEDNVMCKSSLNCTPESPSDMNFEMDPLTEAASPIMARAWLTNHRFPNTVQALGNFSGSDILRLSRDDLIQICGLADGIRLFNALHAERAPAKLTIYVKKCTETNYTAVFLRNYHLVELRRKLHPLLQDIGGNCYTHVSTLFVGGPNGIKIRLTDEVIQNLRAESLYQLEPSDGGILLRPSVYAQSPI
ncbi:transcription factor CP2 like gemini isoform X2 [Arctopsyche grandis]|uniref:transcription factor CP2 like gemini isoform X2 n=1 Tax=Arctopsyche grandis TaxID=121162 RepID=UPI00406D773A